MKRCFFEDSFEHYVTMQDKFKSHAVIIERRDKTINVVVFKI